MKITPNMIDAIKVQFLQPIFEDSFVERGMKAWLTKIEWYDKHECYRLYFDFTEFEAENEKYLTETYYPNSHTKQLNIDKPLYTAKEAGMYDNKEDYLFAPADVKDWTRDDVAFEQDIQNYLKVLEN